MFWIAAVMMFSIANQDFLEMVEERQAQGHDWHWVGRTEVTDNYIALPAVEQDNTEVFYWEIKE